MATEKIGPGGGIGVDTRELKAFVRALRKASPVAAKGLRTSLKVSGEIVAAEARNIASQHSTTIPATIKVGVYGATVSVRAGKGVPLASLYELGNKGSGGGRGGDTFRHPVFGRPNEPWATQARYPFLRPAAQAKGAELQAEVMKVADQVANVITGHTGF